MAQTFLDTGQDGLVVPRLDIDHTVWRKVGLGQRRSKEVGTCEAPQPLALGARGNPGGDERGRRAVDRAVTDTRDLVQRAEPTAFAGASGITPRTSTWQHRLPKLTSALQPIH